MSLYALLGVSVDASLEEIEAGYLRAREALGPKRPSIDLRWCWRLHRLLHARACLGDPARRQRGCEAMIAPLNAPIDTPATTSACRPHC